jgi:hypothetical protein
VTAYLSQAVDGLADDDELLALHPAVDSGTDVPGWRRVAHRAEADRLVVAHDPRLA